MSMKFTEEITLRQFKAKAKRKDSFGNYGVVDYMKSHYFKNDKTLLKCTVKRLIKTMTISL